MKIKVAILGMVAVTCIAGSVVAQETDDMYFNSTDRAKLNASKPQKTEAVAYAERKESAATSVEDENINVAEYSARNVNPEFTSRSNSTLAQEDNGDYFINDYRFATTNELNQFNNSYTTWSNSQWYNSGYYAGSMYGGLNSSYYYNSYANPWASPYYQSGWYGSLSYYGGCPYYGNSWSMGMGYGSPYYGGYYGSGYGGGYYGGGYGGYYGGGYYGGGNSYVVVESGRASVYGKRPERGGMNYHAGNNAPSRRTEVSTRPSGNTSGGSTGGRVATNNSGRTQDEYYNRSWRRSSEYQRTNTSSSYPSSGSNTTSWSNSGSNNSRSNSWGTGNSSPAPTRSSSFDSGGGSRSSGSSSSGSSSSGSGSGGRTRGRD